MCPTHFQDASRGKNSRSVNDVGRKIFNQWIRAEAYTNKAAFPFPKTGLVYDYLFLTETKKWTKWMEISEKYEVDINQSFSEIIIPTTDSVRNIFLLDLLLDNNQHTRCNLRRAPRGQFPS